MKTHKIYGIEKAVCTCEQKIAYNLAFACRDWINASEMTAQEAVTACMRQYTSSYDYRPGKYNEQAIENALAAGLPAYRTRMFIAADYETIGNAFPLS